MNGNVSPLQAARLRAAKQWPYLATALYAMLAEESEGVGTMGVDKYWRLYYDPKTLEKWDVMQTASVLYHEVLHLLRRHHQRSEAIAAHPQLANITQDAEINDGIVDDGGRLPEGCILPETIGQEEGQVWEVYYRALEQQAEKREGSGRGQSQEGEGDPRQGGQFGDNQVPDQSFGGSCAHGRLQPWEHGAPGEKGKDGKANPAGVTEGRGDLLRRKVAEEVRRQANRDPGSVPGHMKDLAKEILEPKIPWRHELRASLRRAIRHQQGMVDYSYQRISRRQDAYGDVLMPSLRAPVPEIAIVIDTSGSMSGLLGQALGEVKGVLKAANCRDVKVICCDVEASQAQRVMQVNHIRLDGGGGTCMEPGMRAAAELRPRPDIVICLTDMYLQWTDYRPPYKFIIGALSDGGRHYPPPEWARVVEIREDGS